MQEVKTKRLVGKSFLKRKAITKIWAYKRRLCWRKWAWKMIFGPFFMLLFTLVGYCGGGVFVRFCEMCSVSALGQQSFPSNNTANRFSLEIYFVGWEPLQRGRLCTNITAFFTSAHIHSFASSPSIAIFTLSAPPDPFFPLSLCLASQFISAGDYSRGLSVRLFLIQPGGFRWTPHNGDGLCDWRWIQRGKI